MSINEAKKNYQVDIGIESHVQLKTESKLFCSCSNDSRTSEPNVNVCPVCLGLPGTLPVLNKRAIELAMVAGLALNAKIAKHTKFDRKNYFYPDLPKGYQITQFDKPIVGEGYVEVPGEDGLKVGITRAHLEEDAGKSTHPEDTTYSLVDLNRAGTPLLEIVSEPDMHSADEAKRYAMELYNIMRYSGVSDVDLYHGNMRFDVNVSVRKKGEELGTRTETKNLNSFKSIERAVEYEIDRQIRLLESGDKVQQATMGWDEAMGKTFIQRVKEEAHDYRYFPEPDIPPVLVIPEMLESAKDALPELPVEIRNKLSKAGLSKDELSVLMSEPVLTQLALRVADQAPSHLTRAVNWLVTEVMRMLNDEFVEVGDMALIAENLSKLSQLVEEDKLSSTSAKKVLEKLVHHNKDPEEVAKDMNLIQVSDTSKIESIVKAVIDENPKAVEDYKSGNRNVIGFLVGQVMKQSRGQANPKVAQKILSKHLND